MATRSRDSRRPDDGVITARLPVQVSFPLLQARAPALAGSFLLVRNSPPAMRDLLPCGEHYELAGFAEVGGRALSGQAAVIVCRRRGCDPRRAPKSQVRATSFSSWRRPTSRTV